MEILKNHTGEVKFVVPPDLAIATFKVFRGTQQIGNSQQATVAGGMASVSVPWAATTEDGVVDIELRFNYQGDTYYQRSQVTVATPYLPLYEVKKIIDTTDDEEAARVEAAARHIINSHTGQNFGKFIGKISVSGSGEANLRLPRRLITFNSINGSTYWGEMLALRGSGWYLQFKRIGIPSVRSDFDGWHYERNSGVITAPPVDGWGGFVKHAEFEIDGVWGWEEVPVAVSEAARLLVSDYACEDALYRDRFLTSMTAADWRIQFHEGAFSNTGNVRANQLLAEFVLRRGWVVV